MQVNMQVILFASPRPSLCPASKHGALHGSLESLRKKRLPASRYNCFICTYICLFFSAIYKKVEDSASRMIDAFSIFRNVWCKYLDFIRTYSAHKHPPFWTKYLLLRSNVCVIMFSQHIISGAHHCVRAFGNCNC